MEDVRNTYKMLIEAPAMKRSPRKYETKWGIILKWFLRETAHKGVDWIHLRQQKEQ
jgi:hypothetical protein